MAYMLPNVLCIYQGAGKDLAVQSACIYQKNATEWMKMVDWEVRAPIFRSAGLENSTPLDLVEMASITE